MQTICKCNRFANAIDLQKGLTPTWELRTMTPPWELRIKTLPGELRIKTPTWELRRHEEGHTRAVRPSL